MAILDRVSVDNKNQSLFDALLIVNAEVPRADKDPSPNSMADPKQLRGWIIYELMHSPT